MHGLADDAREATGRDPGRVERAAARRRGAPLFEGLGEAPGCRKARGRRHPPGTVPAVAVAARLAGCRGVTAFARFAAPLPQERPEAAGAFFGPGRQRHAAPATATFHDILAGLPPDAPDEAVGRRTARDGPAPARRPPWTARTSAAPRGRPGTGGG